MKAKKLFPDLSIKRLWDKIKGIEDKVNDLDTNIVEEINSKIPFSLAIDENGNYGYIKEGADSVTPFKSGGCVTTNVTFTKANETKKINISEIFPNYKNITKDNIFVQINTTNYVHTAGSSGTFSRYNGLPKLSSYNSKTGDISLNSGQLGFGYTGMGQHYEYATSMTIIISS